MTGGAGPLVAQRVAQWLGLQFAGGREPELARGLAAAAQEAGCTPSEFVQELLVREPDAARLQLLARHLTIGETYFFRDAPLHDALAHRILPPLLQARRGSGRHLRVWSAACATGEEPYSLAIVLRQILPDVDGWNVSILATDLNEAALQRARAGIYGEWSFRAMPPLLRAAWFERLPDGRMQVVPQVRRMVEFRCLNLAQDADGQWPRGAFDLVLCRNVLMYFGAQLRQRTLHRLHDALAEGGWLALGPGEATPNLPATLAQVVLPGTIVFQRRPGLPQAACVPSRPEPLTRARREPPIIDHAREARRLANQGLIAQARACCERWIAGDRVNAGAHYLHGTLLMAQGQTDAAVAALRRALFLAPDFVLAHVAAGQLAASTGREADARRHLRLAQELLQQHDHDEPLPHGDGLTAGALAETVARLLARESA